MEKRLLFLLSLLIIFISCDKEGNLYEEITGYNTFTTSFIQQELKDQYKIVFDGQEVIGQTVFTDRKATTGKLEVYDIKTNKVVYTDELSITSGMNVQFIMLDNKLDVYTTEKYTFFNTLFIPINNSEKEQYSIYYNKSKISLNFPTYINKKDLKGKIEIYKDDQLVGDEDNVEIQENGVMTLLEFKDQNTQEIKYTVLKGGSLTEKEPANATSTKIRFFYSKVDVLSEADSIRLEIFTFDQNGYPWDDSGVTEPHSKLTIKAGEVSNYVEFDMAKYRKEGDFMPIGVFYTIYDAAPSGKILFNSINQLPMNITAKGWEGEDVFTPEYMFQTNYLESAWGWVSNYTVSGEKKGTTPPAETNN